jgi:hypothetical protein
MFAISSKPLITQRREHALLVANIFANHLGQQLHVEAAVLDFARESLVLNRSYGDVSGVYWTSAEAASLRKEVDRAEAEYGGEDALDFLLEAQVAASTELYDQQHKTSSVVSPPVWEEDGLRLIVLRFSGAAARVRTGPLGRFGLLRAALKLGLGKYCASDSEEPNEVLGLNEAELDGVMRSAAADIMRSLARSFAPKQWRLFADLFAEVDSVAGMPHEKRQNAGVLCFAPANLAAALSSVAFTMRVPLSNSSWLRKILERARSCVLP